jgi:hypothetical protein
LRNTNVVDSGLQPERRKWKTTMAGMHAVRHYHVTAVMESDYPLETIDVRIGQRSESMILRLSHLRPDFFEKYLAAAPPDVLSGVAPKGPLEKKGPAA